MKYQVSGNEIQGFFNYSREMLLDKLEELGLLKEPARDIKAKYAFVILEKNTLGKYLDRLLFGKDGTPRVQLIETKGVVPEMGTGPELKLVKNEEEKPKGP